MCHTGPAISRYQVNRCRCQTPCCPWRGVVASDSMPKLFEPCVVMHTYMYCQNSKCGVKRQLANKWTNISKHRPQYLMVNRDIYDHPYLLTLNELSKNPVLRNSVAGPAKRSSLHPTGTTRCHNHYCTVTFCWGLRNWFVHDGKSFS